MPCKDCDDCNLPLSLLISEKGEKFINPINSLECSCGHLIRKHTDPSVSPPPPGKSSA